MNVEQERYLMKRLEDIRNEKLEEINNEALKKRNLKYGTPNNNGSNIMMMELKNYLKKIGKENIKVKKKITPKIIYDLLNLNKNTYSFILEIFDLSEFEKEIKEIENERAEKCRKLNECIDKFKRDMILKNECNDIIGLIKDFESIKI